MPALRHPEIVSTDRDLGPNVPTIFVIAEKKLCKNHQQQQQQFQLNQLLQNQ
jgi:hypothetical protein